MELLAEDALTGATGATPSASVQTGASTVWLMATIVLKPAPASEPRPRPMPARRTCSASAAKWEARRSPGRAANGGSQITAYTVTTYNGSRRLTSTTVSGTRAAIGGLRNGGDYRFRWPPAIRSARDRHPAHEGDQTFESAVVGIFWCTPPVDGDAASRRRPELRGDLCGDRIPDSWVALREQHCIGDRYHPVQTFWTGCPEAAARDLGRASKALAASAGEYSRHESRPSEISRGQDPAVDLEQEHDRRMERQLAGSDHPCARRSIQSSSPVTAAVTLAPDHDTSRAPISPTARQHHACRTGHQRALHRRGDRRRVELPECDRSSSVAHH